MPLDVEQLLQRLELLPTLDGRQDEVSEQILQQLHGLLKQLGNRHRLIRNHSLLDLEDQRGQMQSLSRSAIGSMAKSLHAFH